jgi:hypothetical protein
MKRELLLIAFGVTVFSVGADTSADVTVVEESASCQFNSTYLGLGLGGSFLENEFGSIKKQKVNRFLGTVAFGGGKTFGKFYAGGELSADFMKSKIKKVEGGAVRNRGITPRLAARFGLVQNDWMAYLKTGVALPKATLRDESNAEVGDVSKVTYLVALGGERFFCKKFSVRGEVEYVFPAKKTFSENGETLKTKTNGGFNIRALVAYNVQY